MTTDVWKSWNELRKIARRKKVVLWGRSEDWVHKTLRGLEPVDVAYIVDSNQAYAGTSFAGLDVRMPSALASEGKESLFIVITGGVYESIAESIEQLGYEAGAHYCVTPEIRDWALLHEIKDHDQTLVVCCSDYPASSRNKRSSEAGGGLYTLNTQDRALVKRFSACIRQAVQVGEAVYAVEFPSKSVIVLSTDFHEIDRFPLDRDDRGEERPNACGIAYHQPSKVFFVANSGSDTINIYDEADFKLLDTVHFSEKFKEIGDEQHHINDICVAGDCLYVSYFSLSGNWRRAVNDGGVSEYNILSLESGHVPVIQGLWKPHSVEYLDGNLCVLDSMRGEFYVGSDSTSGKFPGFVRGLAFDSRFYYVGQSEDMYASRLFRVSNNVMTNAGVWLFDMETKCSRFFSCPEIMNIHDLLILE